MFELVHRVKVFVFDFAERAPSYLLVRPHQGVEACWGPVHAPLGLGEQLETAIRRSALEGLGLARPAELIDLQMPSRWVIGDEEVIEWCYGYRPSDSSPDLHLADSWADARWADFGEAYPSLELEPDRAAILRLHTLIAEN